MIRRLLHVASAIALMACSQPNSSQAEPVRMQDMTAAHLADLIEADGAAHTYAVLTGPAAPDGLDPVFAGIATGEAEWLALVPALQPLTDGFYAEGLQSALGQGLVANPEGVLALMPDYGSYFFVCAEADGETRALVAAVTDPALEAAKTECLAYIDGTAPEMIEMNAPAQ